MLQRVTEIGGGIIAAQNKPAASNRRQDLMPMCAKDTL
jgi:hypothetical protein